MFFVAQNCIRVPNLKPPRAEGAFECLESIVTPYFIDDVEQQPGQRNQPSIAVGNRKKPHRCRRDSDKQTTVGKVCVQELDGTPQSVSSRGRDGGLRDP